MYMFVLLVDYPYPANFLEFLPAHPIRVSYFFGVFSSVLFTLYFIIQLSTKY